MSNVEIVDKRNVRTGLSIPEERVAPWVDANEGMRQLVFYINADLHDDEDVASGTLAVHSQGSTVRADSIPHSMFQHIVAVPILDHSSHPNGWTDADFVGKEALLQEAAPQYSDNPPTLECRGANGNHTDADVWSPELGQDDSFAGVFKQVRPNMRDADYFVVVKAGVPEACRQLREELIAEGADLTYEKLIADPRLHYVNHLALRNAKRIAYQIAERLRVPIPAVEDASAYAPSSFAAKPMRAEPVGARAYAQSVSSIQRIRWKAEDCVGVFHKVRPVSECLGHNVVVGSPYDGISVFTMEERPRGLAVPADIGKRVPLDGADLTHPETARRHKGVVWEGEHTALKALAPNVHHTIDDEFYRAMDQMGWRQQGTNRVATLVPVLLKVSNFDYKRVQ